MIRKFSHLSLFLIVIGSLLLPSAISATVITDFDGTYTGKFTITVSVTTSGSQPQTLTKSQTLPFQLLVHNGVITGWGQGSVINKAGKSSITMVIPPYGKLISTAFFSRSTTTSVITLTGTISGRFPAMRTVVNGTFTATGGNKFTFSVRPSLQNAQIGKKYPDYYFCDPVPLKGMMCGSATPRVNPTGGKPPYSFRLKVGSSLLPTGMVLNSRTGQLSGTPIAGQTLETKKLIVCAYDSNDWFTGLCRTTTLTLTR